jgi:hypothetical protein
LQKLAAVILTPATWDVGFEMAVASPDRRKESSFAAAVKSTDRSSGQRKA